MLFRSDAPDAAAIAAADLMSLPAEAWETLRFTALPSLRRLALAFDVPQAWQKRKDVEPGNLEVAAADGPVQWIVWRPERTTHFRSMEADEAALLDAMLAGKAFPEMCQSIVPLAGEHQAAARAAALLRGWVEGGMIATFRH